MLETGKGQTKVDKGRFFFFCSTNRNPILKDIQNVESLTILLTFVLNLVLMDKQTESYEIIFLLYE